MVTIDSEKPEPIDKMIERLEAHALFEEDQPSASNPETDEVTLPVRVFGRRRPPDAAPRGPANLL